MLPRRLLRQQIIYKIYRFLPAGQGVLKQPNVVFPLKAEQSTRFTSSRDARSASRRINIYRIFSAIAAQASASARAWWWFSKQ